MLIEKVHLISFKGFEDFVLDCHPITGLVGLNNNGKTSVLQAIQLTYDLLGFVFGQHPNTATKGINFGNPQWQSNPQSSITRLSIDNPELLWLNKKTSVPCQISVSFKNNIEVRVDISGPSMYELDILKEETSIKNRLNDTECINLVEELFATSPIYVPPVTGLSPIEQFWPYQELIGKLNRGQIAECWRSNLYWIYNDGDKNEFFKIVETVQRYLPNVTILPPKLSHSNPPQVLIEFDQGGVIFDISTSGGGLRTILGLAVVLHFSNSKCLLLDEPDAHLHSSLQHKVASMLLDHVNENDVQILFTSHAPDFIAELPTEYLMWIDRTTRAGRPCDEIGKYLIDLGAMSKADAIRSAGADKILFIEGGLDKTVITKFVEDYCNGEPKRINVFEDKEVIIAELPNGKGDAEYLEVFQRFLKQTFKLDVKIACIVDNDYDIDTGDNGKGWDQSQPLLIKLQRKEIENYLLDPKLISTAAAKQAEAREKQTGKPVGPPSVDEVEKEIDRIFNLPQICDTVKYQLLPKYRDSLDSKYDPSTKEVKANEWFSNNWETEDWRLQFCPGKTVLTEIRKWCQEDYSLSLSSGQLVSCMDQYPNDIHEMLGKIQNYFYT